MYKEYKVLNKEKIKQSFKAILREVEIANVKIELPAYGSIIRKKIDFNIFHRNINLLKNTNVVCYPLTDAEQFKTTTEQTFFDISGGKIEIKYNKDILTIIDPKGEYLVSKVKSEREKFLAMKDLPAILKQIFSQNDISTLKSLLKETNEKLLSSIIEWYMKKEMMLGSKIPISPSVPIKGNKTLKYATTMNRIGQTIQSDNEWQNTVYYLFEYSSFKNEELIKQTLKNLFLMKPDIFIFNIRNYKFSNKKAKIERIILKSFFDGLNKLKQLYGTTIIWLNADSLGYLSLGLCVDIFVEPLDLNFNPDLRIQRREDLEDDTKKTAQDMLGIFFNPSDLTYLRGKEIYAWFNNSNSFPCNCINCKSYENSKFPFKEYNEFRRNHLLTMRDQHITELKEEIKTDKLKGAVVDRISQSNEFSIFSSFF